MARLRFRGGDQRQNGSLLLLALGAVAGVALGMVLAERAGGVSGLRARVGRGLGQRQGSSDDDMLESMRLAHGAEAADYHDEYDDEDFDEHFDEHFDDDLEDEFGDELQDEFDHDHGDGMSAVDHAIHVAPRAAGSAMQAPRRAPSEAELEARVLEVFRNDPMLRGQAIDIGAIGNGTIELTGWVKSAAEVRYASILAGGVLDVLAVMDSLAVRGTNPSRVGAARTAR